MGNLSCHFNSAGASPSNEGTELQSSLLPSSAGSGRVSPNSMEQNRIEKGIMKGNKKTAEQSEKDAPKKSWSRFIAFVCASLAILWRFLVDHLPLKFRAAVSAFCAFLPEMLRAVAIAGPAFLQLTAVWKGFLTLDDNNFRLQKIEKDNEDTKKMLKDHTKMLEQLLKQTGGTPPDDCAGKNQDETSAKDETPLPSSPELKTDGDDDALLHATAAEDGGGDDENNQPPVEAQPASPMPDK